MKEKRNKPIRFDKVLPSSMSSYFRPAPVCPSFSLNNWYSFRNLEEADEYELKEKKKCTAQDSYQQTSYSYHYSQQNHPELLCRHQQKKRKQQSTCEIQIWSLLQHIFYIPHLWHPLWSQRKVLWFFLFCFVYLCLFIIFRSESWRCRFDSLLFDSYHCHTIDSLHCRSTDS